MPKQQSVGSVTCFGMLVAVSCSEKSWFGSCCTVHFGVTEAMSQNPRINRAWIPRPLNSLTSCRVLSWPPVAGLSFAETWCTKGPQSPATGGQPPGPTFVLSCSCESHLSRSPCALFFLDVGIISVRQAVVANLPVMMWNVTNDLHHHLFLSATRLNSTEYVSSLHVSAQHLRMVHSCGC